MQQKLEEAFIQVLHCDPASLVPEATLVNDLGADSLDLISLVLHIEKAYKLPPMPDSELDSLITVADVEKFVEEAIHGASAKSGVPSKEI